MDRNAPLLEVKDLCKSFGALVVADRVSMALRPGARHALIGPNGAGKTTLVNLITGTVEPSGGAILLGGEDVTHWTQARRVKNGLARTFQINTLFRGLSVLENVCMAISERRALSARLWRRADARADVIAEGMDLLESVKLDGDARQLVRELPYGRQRLVELAIALGLRPTVLLLDEPAAGVPSAESHVLLEAVEALPESMAILMIEHDMDIVFRFAQRVTVLVQGAILTDGAPAEVGADPRVQEVYLGENAELHGGRR